MKIRAKNKVWAKFRHENIELCLLESPKKGLMYMLINSVKNKNMIHSINSRFLKNLQVWITMGIFIAEISPAQYWHICTCDICKKKGHGTGVLFYNTRMDWEHIDKAQPDVYTFNTPLPTEKLEKEVINEASEIRDTVSNL